MSPKRLFLILLVLLVIGSVTPTVAQEREFRMALPEGDVVTLDPQAFCCLGDAQVLFHVYEGLVQYDPQTLQPVPALAESWEVSDDGLVYTFHLREATFHSGRAVTAADVVNSFNRLAKPPEGIVPAPTYATSIIIGSFAGYAETQDGSADTLSGVQAVDDRTVEITLTRPNSALLAALTMVPASVLPQENAVDPTTFTESTNGTGPFMVEEWVRQDHITLVRNPNYWGEQPALDRVIMRVIPEKSVVLVEFLAGGLDIAVVPPSDVVRISEDPALAGRVQNQSILSIFWLTPNITEPPLDNLQVRQALTTAIDRQAIVDSVLQGQGVIAHGPLPPGLSAYDPEYDPFPYDPERARQLLAEAGFPDGVDVEFRTWNDEVEGRVLTAIQAQWAEVGIRATFNRTEYTAYISDLTNCNLTLGTQSWTADYADPDNFIIPLISDSGTAVQCGLAGVTEPKELALEALTLPLGAERDELYRQAERAVVENVLGIFLYHRGATMVTGENVQGAYLDPYNNVILDTITLTS